MTLIQQYIKPKEPYIIRAEFIAGQLTYAVQISTEQGFELCPADSCAAEEHFCPTSDNNRFRILKHFKHPEITTYLDLIRLLTIDIAGIEMIIDERHLAYTYDINFNTNYNCKAEQIAGISNYDYLVEFLARTLEQQTSLSHLSKTGSFPEINSPATSNSPWLISYFINDN